MYQNDAPQPPMTPNAWNGQGYGQPPQSYAQPTGSPYGQARPEAGVQGSWKPPAPPAEPAAPPVQPDGNRSVEQPPIVPHEMPPMQETPDTYADDAPQDDLNDHME